MGEFESVNESYKIGSGIFQVKMLKNPFLFPLEKRDNKATNLNSILFHTLFYNCNFAQALNKVPKFEVLQYLLVLLVQQ